MAKGKLGTSRLEDLNNNGSDSEFEDSLSVSSDTTIGSEKPLTFAAGKSGKSQQPSGISRLPGTLLKKLIQTGMKTPIIKYLLNPNTIHRALNHDHLLRESYLAVLKSEPVQKLMTPEALRIILESDTAKKIITPENFKMLLDLDLVAEFFKKDNIRFLLNTEVMEKLSAPQALLLYMRSKAAKEFYTAEVMHEISRSALFANIMDADLHADFLECDGVRAITTKEAVEDAFKSPAALKNLNSTYTDRMMTKEAVINVASHPQFHEHLMYFFQQISKLTNDSVENTEQ